MYDGRNRSLLPSDFIDNFGGIFDIPNQQDNTDKNKSKDKDELEKNPDRKDVVPNKPQYVLWAPAKKMMSKYISGNGGRNAKENAISSYVKSYGGSRNAAKTAKSAIKTTTRIGNFFGGILNKGITQVLNDYNIQTEGRKPKEILNDIVNVLAPEPDSLDNSVVRKALINTMSIVYEMFDDENKDILLLDSLDYDITIMLIIKYFETFIYERLINDMGSRIEMKAKDSDAAVKLEKELKDYIETKVSMTLKNKLLSSINFQAKDIQEQVEKLYQQCYNVLEDQL